MNQKTIDAKAQTVESIASLMKENNSVVVVEYRGLSVASLTDLRRQLRAENASLKVYKNNLVVRAAKSLGYEGLESSLTGPNAVVIGKEATVAPSILAKFAKKEKLLVIKGGVVEGKVLNDNEIKEVAKLPNKEGMLAMLLGCLNASIAKFAATVKAVGETKNA